MNAHGIKVLKRVIGSILCFCMANGLMAQGSNWKKEAKSFQKELNRQYRDVTDSPLDSLDRIDFKRHEFFPISEAY
jgi:hypothetical protein